MAGPGGTAGHAPLDEGLRRLAAAMVPGGRLEAVEPLSPDDASAASAAGHRQGRGVRRAAPAHRDRRRRPAAASWSSAPWRPTPSATTGAPTASTGLVLAYDGFGRIPGHVAALDVGAIGPDGAPVSLRGAGEPYLVTEFAAGRPYADDLREVAVRGAGPLDLARCDALIDWLVRLHATPVDAPVAWRRAVRDLVGHGEGIFGIVDGYGDDVPAAPPSRLEALEARAVAWRWRLRPRASRLRQTHGDFHPFNVIFAEGTRFTLLDSSRGGVGDPGRRPGRAHHQLPVLRARPARRLERPGGPVAARLGALPGGQRRRRAARGGGPLPGLASAGARLPALLPGALARRPRRAARARRAGARRRGLRPGLGRGALRVSGAVAWFTGLPSSGKSTLAERTRARLAEAGVPAVLLDGDEVRGALVPAPGYTAVERDAFYETLARLAALLASQGFRWCWWPPPPTGAPTGELARALTPRFVEVHVATPPGRVRGPRRQGALGRGARRAGAAPARAGLAYEPPEAPEVVARGGHDEAALAAVCALLGRAS